jgi:DNA ligase (NAD+)
MVITINEKRVQSGLGFGTNTPKFSIAVKFASTVVETKVCGFEWQVSRNGRVVPTVLLDPISVEGSTISRATGDNYQQVMARGISVGSTVLLSKAGLTIPKILAVTKRAPVFDAQLPTTCPACGNPLVESGVDLACRAEYCKGQVVGRMMHFFSVIAPGKVGISETFFQTLYDAGLVKDIADLFTVSRGAMLATPGIGESRINAFLAAIDGSREMQLSTLLKSLSIPGLGDTWAGKIAEMLGNDGSKLLSPVAMTYDVVLAMLQSKGAKVSSNILANFCTWFAVPVNVQMIQRMLQAGVKVLCDVAGVSADPNAVHFCVTGKTSIPRNEFIKMIEKCGFVSDSSVTKKTKILICNTPSGSSKFRKAQASGVEIITEPEMLARISKLTNTPVMSLAADKRDAISVGENVLFKRGIEVAEDTREDPKPSEPNSVPVPEIEDLDIFDA